MDKILQLVRELTDEQFYELLQKLALEERERKNRKLEEAGQVKLLESQREEGILDNPSDIQIDDLKEGQPTNDIPTWVSPGTIHSKMYTPGQVVKHNGKIWVSTHPGLNHWEPGATGVDDRIWQEVPTHEVDNNNGDTTPDTTTTGKPADNTLKWKSGLNLKPGTVVNYNGVKYEVIQQHTSQADWTPDVVPALYKKL